MFLLKASQPQGGIDMSLKVIFSDGTIGTIKFSILTNLIKSGKIVAFQCSDDWVELRRKRNDGYKGVDRRVNSVY